MSQPKDDPNINLAEFICKIVLYILSGDYIHTITKKAELEYYVSKVVKEELANSNDMTKLTQQGKNDAKKE